MRTELFLLIALVVAVPLRAQSGSHPHGDEYAALVKACGAPRSVKDKRDPSGGRHAIDRDMKYRDLEFFLLRNDEETWAVTAVFKVNGDDTISRDVAVPLMPCLGNMKFGYVLEADDAPAVAPAAAPVPATSDDRDLMFAALGVIGVVVLVVVLNARAWNGRPQRLCTNCYAIAQPFQHKDKRWYCPHCQADNPIPLDSPWARDYMARRYPPAPQPPHRLQGPQ